MSLYTLNCQTAYVPSSDFYGVLLHGYGANGADLINLAPIFQHAYPTLSIIAPNAPDICAQNPSGFEWFDLRNFSPAAMESGAEQALPKLLEFLASVTEEHQIGYDQLVLIGFSQGTAMALQAMLGLEHSVHAVVGFSGFLAQSHPKNQGNTSCPVHLVHGDQDSVVPIAASQKAQSQLQDLGYTTSFHPCAGLDHGINDEGLHSAIEFLGKV